MKELLDLVVAAGHVDFRDARGPLQLTQRQASGKFTRDEADGYIARLRAEAEFDRETGRVPHRPESTPRPTRIPKTRSKVDLAGVESSALAEELQSRGWVVMEP